MKQWVYNVLVFLGVCACGQHSHSTEKAVHAQSAELSLFKPDTLLKPGRLFTLRDAEKILGEKARLADSLSSENDKRFMFLSEYLAISKDPKSGKTGSVYFTYEKFKELSIARKKYFFIKKANEKHEGIKTLEGIGDEAYYHSDGENFHFIMVRKDKVVFNMKVNKTTSHTSLEAFMEVTRDIVDLL